MKSIANEIRNNKCRIKNHVIEQVLVKVRILSWEHIWNQVGAQILIQIWDYMNEIN